MLNQRISETDKDGITVSYAYYPNGNLYKTTNPDGTYVLYTYDQSWNVIGMTDQSGNTVAYTYDAMGNVTAQRDALGNTYKYEYDALGRLIKETDANGNSTTYTYDANSNCIKKTNALGVSAHMTYDALNRMTAAYMTGSDGTEYRVSYTYDALGRVISFTDEEGYTTHMTYDAASNLVSITDANGVVTGVNSYDNMGRMTSSTDALGVTTDYSYDVMGNLMQTVKALNSGNTVTSYTYDTMGRVISVTDALQGKTTATYDARGNVATITDANGGTTTYTYDTMDRLTLEVSAIGSSTSYTYNAEGLLAGVENARGQKTAYTYDAVGRITSMTDELGTVSYTYDANGNVLTVTDGQGTITRTYDALNRVTTYTDYQGNTVKYAYDQIGNLVSLTYPGGEIVRYTYYKNGWLHTVTDTNGLVTTYGYDCNGNMTRCERPNGTAEICTYNAAGLLVEQKDVKASADGAEEVITSYTYTYDQSGNITTITGSETTSTKEGISALKSATMTYDADNRLISYNGEEIRYDADGNMTYGPVDGVMSELVYDCRNRLVSAGGVRYTYDAENNRIAQETDAYLEEYVVDTVSSSLSRILTATRTTKSDNAKDVTTYIYGSGLISEYQGDLTLYHHYNNLGSTMKLTDGEGNVVATYTYGAYGELLSGDTTFTSFLYNGRCGVMTDDNGLYYMRQRYYNTEIKRFVNQDVLRGSLGNSQSLNRYSYVQGNPVSYTDPFGLSPLGGLFSDTSFVHAVLAFLGVLPGVGIVANLADAAIYAFVDHDYGMMSLALVSCVTMGASSIAKSVKAGAAVSKTAKYVAVGGSMISNGASFLLNGDVAIGTVTTMIDKYIVNGQGFDSSTGGEVLTLGLSLLGCIFSGKGLSDDTAALGKMLKEDNVVGRLKDALSQGVSGVKTGYTSFMADNRGCVDFSGFDGKVTDPSIQIKGNSYDINKLQKTQPYTYPDNVATIKETIVQNGPNSVPPIEIRVHHEQVLVVDGHHRLEAFSQLGYDRVPIKYLHSTQLGKTLSQGTYYRSIEELLDAAKICN